MAKKNTNGKQKAKHIVNIVFLSIWFILALSLGFGAMSIFTTAPSFENWLIWGVLCGIPVIIPIFKYIIECAKQGAIDGSHDYSVSVSGDRVVVQNHPIRNAIIYMIIGIALSVLAGPIVLAFYLIKNLISFIKHIVGLSKIVKAERAEANRIRAQREAEARAQREAEERARVQADAQARAQQEAMERAQREAEERAQAEAEADAASEAEVAETVEEVAEEAAETVEEEVAVEEVAEEAEKATESNE